MILAPVGSGVAAGGKALLFSSPGSEPHDSFGTWWDDLANDFTMTWRAIGRDAKKAHRSFDRIFFDYDWEDPYL